MLVETTDVDNRQDALRQWKAPELTLRLASANLLPKVARLARAYPYRHSVLGGASAGDYVEKLAFQSQHAGVGWYFVDRTGEALAAAHLSIYGLGDGSGHTLWKIRHPMLAAGSPADSLTFLFEGLADTAIRLRPGTAKIVTFLSEQEQEVIAQAAGAGFKREGRFESYYRLGETCFVYSRTVI
jgi:hypothetical protein